MQEIHLNLPLSEADVRRLKLGDVVTLSGHLYTARDMAHLRIQKHLQEGAPLPKDLRGAAIFHAGPVCLRQDDGSWRLVVIGPTTSIRMEPYAHLVGNLGVRALIGKGGMDEDTLRAAAQYGYVYLQAAPGCAAKLAGGVRRVHDVTWLDMGMPEAMWDLEVERFGPLVVAMDACGNSLYKTLRERAREIAEELYPNG